MGEQGSGGQGGQGGFRSRGASGAEGRGGLRYDAIARHSTQFHRIAVRAPVLIG